MRPSLLRHKDANQSVTATWLGSADALAKKRGTGFQKAAQYPEQTNQPDVPVYMSIEKTETFKPAVDQEVRLASKKQLSSLSKAIRRMSRYICVSRTKVHI